MEEKKPQVCARRWKKVMWTKSEPNRTERVRWILQWIVGTYLSLVVCMMMVNGCRVRGAVTTVAIQDVLGNLLLRWIAQDTQTLRGWWKSRRVRVRMSANERARASHSSHKKGVCSKKKEIHCTLNGQAQRQAAPNLSEELRNSRRSWEENAHRQI